MIEMNSLRIYLWTFWISFKAMWVTNLGDEVEYQGKVWFVSNGVYSQSWSLVRGYPTFGPAPDFAIIPHPTIPHEWIEHAPRNECRKIKTIKNYIRSFTTRWDFWKGYWWQIWERNIEMTGTFYGDMFNDDLSKKVRCEQ